MQHLSIMSNVPAVLNELWSADIQLYNTQNFNSRNLIASHYPHVYVTVFIFPIIYVCLGDFRLESKAEQMVAASDKWERLKDRRFIYWESNPLCYMFFCDLGWQNYLNVRMDHTRAHMCWGCNVWIFSKRVAYQEIIQCSADRTIWERGLKKWKAPDWLFKNLGSQRLEMAVRTNIRLPTMRSLYQFTTDKTPISKFKCQEETHTQK